MNTFFWSSEDKNAIAGMLRDGLSAGEIAARFEGVSRNAIIGVVHRDPELRKIGLSGRPVTRSKPGPKRKPVKHVSPTVIRRAKQPALKPKPLPPERPDPVAPPSLDLRLHELDRTQCKWPVNSPPKGEPYLFCGHPRAGKNYCEHHERKAVRHVD